MRGSRDVHPIFATLETAPRSVRRHLSPRSEGIAAHHAGVCSSCCGQFLFVWFSGMVHERAAVLVLPVLANFPSVFVCFVSTGDVEWRLG